MKAYELTYIINASETQEQVDAIMKQIESFIQSKEGVILNSQKSTAQTLAYPIKKKISGYFITLTFQILEDNLKELKEILEKNKEILRHLVMVKKPAKEIKERRTRKMVFTTEKETDEKKHLTEDKKTQKIDAADLDKKLDEILSE